LAAALAASVLAVGLVFAGKTLTPVREVQQSKAVEPDPPPWPGPVPDPPPGAVRALRDELARGSVQLVGREGLPRWYRWRLGNGRGGAFTPSETGAAFAVSARTECMLELFPAPGIDRYTITAELCHERVVGPPPDRVGGDLPRVGLYFGHDEKPGPGNVRAHASGVVAFSDLGADPPDPGHPPRIHCWDDLLFDGAANGPSFHQPRGLAPLPEPVRNLPGPWRRLEVEVAHDRVVASVDGRAFARIDGESLRDRSDTLQAKVNAQFPDGRVQLARWTPRSPFGLWVYSAQVGVRNVTVTPIRPNP
jgi:hypothetical protein